MRTIPLTLALAAMLTLSGCIAGNEDTPDTGSESMEAEPAPPEGPVVETFSGSTGNAVATPVVSINNGGTYQFAIKQADNVTGWVLELGWESNSPASEQLDLWVRHIGDFAIPPSSPTSLPGMLANNQPTLKATGTSPLRLAFTPDDLQDATEYEVLVRAATPAGLALDQPFTLDMATFENLTFDPDHAFE